MQLLTYSDLSVLRLKDFVGPEQSLSVEESGFQVVVGLGGFESLGESWFGWRQGEAFQTAEVNLDLSPQSLLPSSIADQIIAKLGVPIRRAMTAESLFAAFGKAETDSGQGPRRFLRFVCGEVEQYLIGCYLESADGLVGFFLARKDYCDESG